MYFNLGKICLLYLTYVFIQNGINVMKNIVITRSKKLLAYLIAIHCLMFVTIFSLLAFTCWSLLAAIILIISFIYYAQQYQWLRAKKSLVSVAHNAGKGWSLNYSDQSHKTGLSLESSLVTPQLIILYFNRCYFWHSDVVTLIDDAVDVELFRQLRVYLRTPKTFQQ
tara:strand:+ start:53494 stop:53994 length:501 start_codon:yes stop_codon:yes gene_type:complete